MAETTGIEWTDGTWNAWWGCTRVGPGCDHCYAEALDKRTGGAHWGAKADRRRTSEKNWNEPLRWQRKADDFEAAHGRRRRVFCGSMMDVFDNAVPLDWSHEAYERIEECDRIDWQLLTKRVGNVEDRVPLEWKVDWPKHVGLMITVVNQNEADRDIPKLLALKRDFSIPWVGLSMEPLLGPVDLTRTWPDHTASLNSLTGEAYHLLGMRGKLPPIDWVITGGESGPNARPGNPQWYRDLRDQCAAAGVPFFFKQWGEWVSVSEVAGDGPHHQFEDGRTVRRIGKKAAGSTLDGELHKAFPNVGGA